MRTLNLGILAHVDAGKTSLTERLLYAAGVIDAIGSVDDGSTQTDSLALERQRGITIKAAVVSFTIGDVTVNLIDTPGHPDFIAEVERVLSVLDGAVLVISAVEGVQAQTRVLMRTLQRLKIPTLLFVNKIDRGGADPERVLASDRRAADAGHHRDGRGARCSAPALPAFTPFGADDTAFAARLAELLADHDEALLAAYVDDAATVSYGQLRACAGGADPAGAGPPRLLRLGDHRGGRGCVDGRDRRAAARDRRRRRWPALGHRVQGRAWPGRGEDRLRCGCSRARSASEIGCTSAADGHRDVDREAESGRSRRSACSSAAAAVQRPAVVAGQIGKLWGLGDVRIGDTLGVAARACRTATTSPRRRWSRSSCRADRATRGRSTPRSRSLPSRTR